MLLNKISLPSVNTIEFIHSNEIIAFQARDNCTHVKLNNGSVIESTLPFGRVLEKLIDKGFFQTHKSHAINIEAVRRYHKYGEIELISGDLVPVARRRREDFLKGWV